MRSRAINADKPCRNVSDFLDAVAALRKKWGNSRVASKGEGRQLWFRGQRSAKWLLRPLFHRDEYADAVESEVRLEFESHSLQLATPGIGRGKWEMYFLMQHYGAPTRLLDWTSSPLAGLYFASSYEARNIINDNATVWVFDPWHWNSLHFSNLSGPALPGWLETEPYLQDIEEACDEEKIQKRWPIAIDPPSIDRRIASQSARFLLFGKAPDLIKAADMTDAKKRENKRSRLAQIIIAAERLERIRCELDDLGINQRFLFPDLQGLGMHLSWEWKGFKKERRLY